MEFPAAALVTGDLLVAQRGFHALLDFLLGEAV
jgi:hypothetical protein